MKSEVESAYQSALCSLERRDYTEYELRRKLTQKDFSAEAVNSVIERLFTYNLLNDRRFTSQYLRYHYRDYSKKILAMRLQRKGIDSILFESVYHSISEELEADPEQEALIQAMESTLKKAERKGLLRDQLPKEEQNRILASLYRKGFSISKAKALLNQM